MSTRFLYASPVPIRFRFVSSSPCLTKSLPSPFYIHSFFGAGRGGRAAGVRDVCGPERDMSLLLFHNSSQAGSKRILTKVVGLTLSQTVFRVYFLRLRAAQYMYAPPDRCDLRHDRGASGTGSSASRAWLHDLSCAKPPSLWFIPNQFTSPW